MSRKQSGKLLEEKKRQARGERGDGRTGTEKGIRTNCKSAYV